MFVFEYGLLVENIFSSHLKKDKLGVSPDPIRCIHTGSLEVTDKALEAGHPTPHRGSVERWELCVRILLIWGQDLQPKLLRDGHSINSANLPIPKTSDESWAPRFLQRFSLWRQDRTKVLSALGGMCSPVNHFDLLGSQT